MAAVRHAGDNWQDRSLVSSGRYFSERPRQLSRVLDALLNGRYHGGCVVAHLRGAQASTVPGAGLFAFMSRSTVPMPSAAGDAAANPEGFDRAAFLVQLEDQVAGFFADQWR